MDTKYSNEQRKKRTITLLFGFIVIVIGSFIISNLFLERKSNLSYASQSDTNWQLILANPWNTLPENFTVETKSFHNGHSVDRRIFDDLEMMLEAAKREGLSPIICSSYRTLEKQKSLFENKIGKYLSNGLSDQEAAVEAAKWVAVPGTSEHQTGLAVDIVAKSYQILDKEQENTPEQKWLMENSYKYGFILRYPENKSDLTGINYEPWHYRYVGKEAAKEIYENGICLEEYLNQIL
ncbi:M15 family metallopeptidase [Anaerocolumna aminovalerica]|uniref:M15 family metallopeptidase n=1 Tax=Anaerocolumna aminovalerica TaxID=1527 RepID=UPI000BE27BCD|nr:M15 family metallopeptidase [Anaerocolumna aminovalerica]MBU5331510.1 M15 family metallopeptidase [Anaerocolumna aminovalerica]